MPADTVGQPEREPTVSSSDHADKARRLEEYLAMPPEEGGPGDPDDDETVRFAHVMRSLGKVDEQANTTDNEP